MNRFSGQGVQNTLEKYIPLPFQEMMQAGQAYQQRGDAAEQKQQEVELGLASMEALAGEHQKFRDTFVNDYRQQSAELLKKSGLNTSDPEFARSIKKLTLQFASDPRLQIVKQANEKIKQNDKIAVQMQAEGKLFIKPQFSGADDKGNLNANVGNIEGVNTLDEWTKLGGIAHSSIEDNGKGWKTNKGNLDRWKKGVLGDVDGQRKLVDAYMTSKGYSREQAETAVKTELQSMINQYGIKSDRDYAYDNYQLSLRKASQESTQIPTQVPFELLSYSKPITPNTNNEVSRSEGLSKVNNILSSLSKDGNLNNKPREIANTPENRRKYAGKFKEVDYSLDSRGNVLQGKSGLYKTGKTLSVNDYDKDEVNLLNTARKVLGVKGGSAKEVFSKYSQLLEQFENSANNIRSTDNTKINNATAEVARRQIASGEVYTVKDGNLKKVNLEDLEEDEVKDISNIKDTNISGISSKNLGQLSGYTQFTDSNGKIYYTPIPAEYQKKFSGSKVIENYIQDFEPKNLKQIPISFQKSDGSKVNKNVFINPNQSGIPYVYKGYQGVLIPYKSNDNGKMVGGAIFQTQQGTVTLPLSEIENNEFKSLYINVANSNKIEGNQ